MKYTKCLQLLLEKHGITSSNSVRIGNFNNFEIKIEGDILTIHPKNLSEVDNSLYRIDISKNKSIDYILQVLESQAKSMNDSHERIENIKKIKNDKNFLNQLQTALNKLLKVAA